MNLLGIFDFFIIGSADLNEGTDWLAVIVGACISSFVAWLTVRLTIYYQHITEANKQKIINYNKRSTLIEIHKKINLGYIQQIKHLKIGIRNNFFGSGHQNTVYTFNTEAFNTMDKYDVESLFEMVSDLKLNSKERLILINYKLSLSSMRDKFNTLSKQNFNDAEQIESISKESDNVLSNTLSEIQQIIFSYNGKTIVPVRSKIVEGLYVIGNKVVADNLVSLKQIDLMLVDYQKKQLQGSIRIRQLKLLKGILNTIRKHKYQTIFNINTAQSVIACIENIQREKTKYKLLKTSNMEFRISIHSEYMRIQEFIRLLKNKHRKTNNLQRK